MNPWLGYAVKAFIPANPTTLFSLKKIKGLFKISGNANTFSRRKLKRKTTRQPQSGNHSRLGRSDVAHAANYELLTSIKY